MNRSDSVLGAWLAASALVIACKVQQDVAPEQGASAAPSAQLSSLGSLRIHAAPESGEVAAIAREALVQAAREKRRLVVYVGARWCEPCRKVHEAAERGDLDAAFGNVDLLEFDLDRDGDRLRSAGYKSQYIPLFALPAADGTASGKQIEGAIKGEGAVAFITARLSQLLAH
jgi:thiol-disulfide isomerase/thioredoxin